MNAGDGMSCQGVDNANENIPDEPKNGKSNLFSLRVFDGRLRDLRRRLPASPGFASDHLFAALQPRAPPAVRAAYRQSGRDAREKLLAIFGGREPTDEELIALFTPGDAHAQPNLDHASTQRRKPLMTTDETTLRRSVSRNPAQLPIPLPASLTSRGMTRISCLRVLFAVPAPPFWREGRQTRTWRTSSKIWTVHRDA